MTEFSRSFGYTYDRNLGARRALTSEEHEFLQELRTNALGKNKPFVESNSARFAAILERKTQLGRITIAFDQEEEYLSFTNFVSETYGRRWLYFTNVPVRLSWRIDAWLLREVYDNFPVRPVSIDDFKKAADEIVSPYSFDIANLDNKYVPGSSKPE